MLGALPIRIAVEFACAQDGVQRLRFFCPLIPLHFLGIFKHFVGLGEEFSWDGADGGGQNIANCWRWSASFALRLRRPKKKMIIRQKLQEGGEVGFNGIQFFIIEIPQTGSLIIIGINRFLELRAGGIGGWDR